MEQLCNKPKECIIKSKTTPIVQWTMASHHSFHQNKTHLHINVTDCRCNQSECQKCFLYLFKECKFGEGANFLGFCQRHIFDSTSWLLLGEEGTKDAQIRKLTFKPLEKELSAMYYQHFSMINPGCGPPFFSFLFIVHRQFYMYFLLEKPNLL